MTRKLLCGMWMAVAVWAQAPAQAPAGRWDGTAVAAGLKIPFRIDFEGSGAAFRGTLVHGDERIASTSGSFEGGVARLAFARSRMEAKLDEGQLNGTFDSAGGRIAFTASAYCTCGVEGEAGPDVTGTWRAEDGLRLTVRRAGDDTVVSGPPIGPVSGRFDGIAFQLHYFDGERAALLEMEPKAGGVALVYKVPGAAEKRARAVKAAN